ncbi:MAG: DUF1800 domain-containing protein [Planctomycetaceae bacterium]|nr:DUF1800 domain-containing protein [Planctomycetaceae bacterium]
MTHWLPYAATDAAPWNARRVVHLHRRTVFGAAWDEVQRDLADGPEEAVARVLTGECRAGGTAEDFEHLAGIIGAAAVESGSAERLKAWWIYRVLFSAHPLEERLTLMWHNHFATSNLKVESLRLMRQQNDTLRRHALAPFGDLLKEMSHDPALLLWLDAPSNKAGQPNENLARELMELFTLGIGNYTEGDVKEVARALTGWTVKQDQFREQASTHDVAEKSVLGRTGPWNGEDVVRILVEHPATAGRLAWRLTREFCGEGVAPETALKELAAGLRDHNLDVRWGVETILRSELFFSDANVGSRVADPMSFLVAPLRVLECWRDPPSTLVLAEWLSRMGLDLFYPPNVGGWNGGRNWLSTRAIIARANYAASLAEGRLSTPTSPPPIAEVVAQHVASDDLAEQVRWLATLLCGSTETTLIDSVIGTSEKESGPDNRLSRAVIALLTRPEAQVH